VKGAPIEAGDLGDGPGGDAPVGMPMGMGLRIDPPTFLVADQRKPVVLHDDQEIDPGVAAKQGLAGADHAGEILVDRGPRGHVAQGYGHAVGLGFQVEQNRPFLLGNDHRNEDGQGGHGHQPGQQGRAQGDTQTAMIEVLGGHRWMLLLEV
jgi:hypothetical protein